mmetsp:Transcript_31607/g.55578  ORF Transcript_31607/g.55578 Transcript_31607/m.55578 type:complete len:235 (-) Transcript_31607:195-899(-)|eukprot:CAMPEP_0197520866 /NCGR_PEP_ID=MMETSP1318-20131121/6194_1 /TAXON_ID=552666 /ORGANISM="Partenskyella glossopodia, Strain RCC365" /LENGTH=234 /DNA_ID=CAMNT_0043072623 /DNA_START=169 /DNA_END=873 /DNA_ORIENTATION=-
MKQTAEILRRDYAGDIPKTVQEMCKLPGVGPKMAYLCMQSAWGENAGIGVDVHVHRIVNRLGWVKTKEPEQTRKALEDWLPKEYWTEINPMLVGLGQTTCKARRPQCEKCIVSGLCPSAVLPKNKSKDGANKYKSGNSKIKTKAAINSTKSEITTPKKDPGRGKKTTTTGTAARRSTENNAHSGGSSASKKKPSKNASAGEPADNKRRKKRSKNDDNTGDNKNDSKKNDGLLLD